MLYLNRDDLLKIGVSWEEAIETIKDATELLASGDFSQPVKPYLRYGNPDNRIIAMPAFIGGELDSAGIKWIASYPDNIHKGVPRAHSVTVLNNTGSGEPEVIINSALISVIRTAAVSGFVLKEYRDNFLRKKKVRVGICGYGPIGQYHLRMCHSILGDSIENITLYDLKGVDVKEFASYQGVNISVTDSWEKAYADADIFITCTVSSAPYIDLKPKEGSLQLNVSLRDYKSSYLQYVKEGIIVDNWEEICRENTDIENMVKDQGLTEDSVFTVADLLCDNFFNEFNEDAVFMFNPMGMAIYDMAIAKLFYRKAGEQNIGTFLK